jgi:hypothetical protein
MGTINFGFWILDFGRSGWGRLGRRSGYCQPLILDSRLSPIGPSKARSGALNPDRVEELTYPDDAIWKSQGRDFGLFG